MTNILGPAQVTEDQAMRWAIKNGAPTWFAKLTKWYWRYGPAIGVRPEVAWVQACHETGFGKYGRAVTPEHNNYCGLKIPDPSGLADNDAAAHCKFPNPQTGVLAHIEHLAIYAGCPGFPRPYKKLSPTEWAGCADPRHFSWIVGKATTVEALGGNWAPSSTYGDRLVELLDKLLGDV